MVESSLDFLRAKALWDRQQVTLMAYRANSGHLSTAFSQAEQLVALYYNGILAFDSANPRWDARDRFILSKGQGGIGVYPLLADLGFFPLTELDRFCRGGILGVHAEWNIPGIEVLTGSLGHGLPIATGMALAARADGKTHYVVCMLGDGELYEGSNWEAMFTAGHHRLGHLICVVDRNQQATIGRTDDIKTKADGPIIEPLEAKFESFGFVTVRVDGHNFEELDHALVYAKQRDLDDEPVCIVADTVKGKGVKIMEDQTFFPNHYRLPFGEDLKILLRDLQMDPEEFKVQVGRDVGY